MRHWCLPLILLLAPLTRAQVVEGTVVNADTGAPIVGARVKLDPVPSGINDPIYTKTGTDGHFQFARPPRANYTIMVEAPGYNPPNCCIAVSLMAISRRSSVRTGPPVPVVTTTADADGTLHASVQIPLTAYAVITGEVKDPDGLPLPHTEIEILRKQPVGRGSGMPSQVRPLPGGQFELALDKMIRTDERGRFRVAHLQPGAYYVVATRDALTGTWEPDYHPTYYPSAPDPASAKPVELTAGSAVQTDIRIHRSVGTRVAGRLVKPQSVDRTYTRIDLIPEQSALLNGGRPYANTMNDQFEILNVLPGKYTLSAVTVEQGGNPWNGKPLFGAIRTIEVGARDVTDLDINMSPLADLTGTVVFAEGCQPIPIWIRPQSAVGVFFMPPDEAKPGADGAFVLSRLTPGKYRLSVMTGGLMPVPMASVRLGDREVTKDGFEVPLAGPATLRVMVGCAGARRPQ